MRLLRKYSNRRLYDTVDSRYVNLDEVAGLVRSGEELRVEDARSGDDLTRETLLQVILERDGGADLLPPALLRRIIRVSSGDPASARVRQELAAGLEALHGHLDRAEALYTRTTGQDPAEGWAAAWQAWSAAASTGAPPAHDAPSGWPAGAAPDDLAASMANAWRDTLARAQAAAQTPPPFTPYGDLTDDEEPAPPTGPAFPNGRPAATPSPAAPLEDPHLDALRARLAALETRLRG